MYLASQKERHVWEVKEGLLKLEAHLEEVIGTGCTILLLSLPGCSVQVKGRAKQTALPSRPDGPSHCSGSAKGWAPAIESAELKAEYRILLCASCLWSRLVWPRSHLNR